MKFNSKFNPWFSLILITFGLLTGYLFVNPSKADQDNVINACVALAVIGLSIWMVREIHAMGVEHRARQNASEAMSRALMEKYTFQGTPEELTEWDKNGWQG